MRKGLLIFAILILGTNVIASNNCSFIGSNTQTALQYTNNLISELRSLKANSNCPVSQRSFDSLEDITKFYNFYQENDSLEAEILLQKEKLDQVYSAYLSSITDAESTHYMNKMLEIKTSLIENEATLKISDGITTDEFKKVNIQNVVSEISNVIKDVSRYEGCFKDDPGKAASIIGGLVNLTGSIAGLAGLNPLWAAAGNIVGSLVTELGVAIRNYQWRYIESLDKTALFYNMMCMIEMQANYYCEKETEIDLLKELMKIDLQGDENVENPVWEGFEIQAESTPVLQSWIKNLYIGTPPANPSDAAEQNRILDQISSAEAIQNLITARYKELKEKIDEGGEKYNLIKLYAYRIQGNMTGMHNLSGPSSGTIYFTERFDSNLIFFMLIAPPEVAPTLKIPPVCPEGVNDCDLFSIFLESMYDGDPTSDVVLDKIIANMKKNIDMIFKVVGRDMDRDLLKRRLGDPGVLLAKAEIKDSIYDLTPKEGLKNIYEYIQKSIITLRKYYKYDEDELTCIINYKRKSGCPTPLQEAIISKNILKDMLVILNDNNISAVDRIKLLSKLLRFKENRSLLLVPKFEIILKKDLEAKIELGEILPLESELIHLNRQTILETIRKEGLENDKRTAVDDRKRAQEIITYNLLSFVKMSPLKKVIFNQIKQIKDDYEGGILTSLDTYNEACAILLSLPYKKYNYATGSEIKSLCKDSVATSGWNEIRAELGMDILPELDVYFNEIYKKPYPKRVCTYSNAQKKNTVYGLKDKVEEK